MQNDISREGPREISQSPAGAELAAISNKCKTVAEKADRTSGRRIKVDER